MGAIVRVALGSIGPDGPFPAPFDVVVANIIARVLIELAPALVAAIRPGGTVILAGIIDVKEEPVHDAFKHLGMSFVRREAREDWVALVMRKPDS